MTIHLGRADVLWLGVAVLAWAYAFFQLGCLSVTRRCLKQVSEYRSAYDQLSYDKDRRVEQYQATIEKYCSMNEELLEMVQGYRIICDTWESTVEFWKSQCRDRDTK